jgi:multidrug transporter EmrE-like cation transporter
MAGIDVVVLSLLKARHIGEVTGNWVFIFAFLVYGFQSIVFYKALSFATLTTMNIVWDVTSDVLVTLMGLYFFKEALTWSQKIGVLFAMIAMVLLK